MIANAPTDEATSVRVITDEREWDAIRGEWEELYRLSPSASAPLDFTWLRSWWRVYGSIYGASGLRILTVRRRGELIGALPLYLGRQGGFAARHLRFISTGEAEHEEICPDYLNLLYRAGDETLVAGAIWGAIGRLHWDHLDLCDVPDDSPLLSWKEAPRGHVRAKIESRGICPVAELGNGFDEYLKSLSANTRQYARRHLRASERAGASFELAAEKDTETFFDDLIRLHQERWTAEGKPGVFAAQRFTQFHRNLVHEWITGGRAVLARLSHGGQVYAVLYGFRTGTKFDFYQSGIKRTDTGPFGSPGTTAHLLLMSALAAQGVTQYDFLRGSSSYKQRLATTEKRLIAIRVWRPTLRAATHHSLKFAQRVTRKGLRLFRKR